MNNNCIFCNIVEKKQPTEIIFEQEDILVIKDIAPQSPIHLLILPKKHIENIKTIEEYDIQLLSSMFFVAQELSKKLQNCDFKLVINNGKSVGQHVFHLHVHFLSGRLNN
jgi:histidine triad (HIT) family protein